MVMKKGNQYPGYTKKIVLTANKQKPDVKALENKALELLQAWEENRISISPVPHGTRLYYVDRKEDPPEIKSMYFLGMSGSYHIGVTDMSFSKFVMIASAYPDRSQAREELFAIMAERKTSIA